MKIKIIMRPVTPPRILHKSEWSRHPSSLPSLLTLGTVKGKDDCEEGSGRLVRGGEGNEEVGMSRGGEGKKEEVGDGGGITLVAMPTYSLKVCD